MNELLERLHQRVSNSSAAFALESLCTRRESLQLDFFVRANAFNNSNADDNRKKESDLGLVR